MRKTLVLILAGIILGIIAVYTWSRKDSTFCGVDTQFYARPEKSNNFYGITP